MKDIVDTSFGCQRPARRLIAEAILSLFLLVPVPLEHRAVAQISNPRDENELKRAQEFFSQGQNSQGMEVLRSYLKIHPHSYDANEMMGLALVSEKRFSDARLFLVSATQAHPASALAHANLAADLAQLQYNEEAGREFRRALQLDPENAELNHNVGEFFAGTGKVHDAVSGLKKAQSLRPSYDNGYDLALAELESGMFEDAENDIRLLLKQRQTAELHSLLGEVLEKKRDYLGAAQELQQSAVLDPSESNIFVWGAELLRHQTLEPAAQIFEKGAEKYPSSWRMFAGLGVSRYLLGQNSKAADALCAAIDLDPSNAQPYYLLSRVHGIPKDKAESVSQRFERYIQMNPKDAKARFYYATNLSELDNGQVESGKLNKIESLLQQAISLDPHFAEAHLQLGILYAHQSRPEAMSEFERSIALDPSLGTAHYRLGQLLIRSGQKERGRQELETWNKLKKQQDEETERKEKEILQFIYTPTQ
jgi:Tfp pilus assembly protein PilF